MLDFSGTGVYADAALVTFGIQFTGFAVAAALQTEVFYDVLGGVNFLVLAGVSSHSYATGASNDGDGAATTNATDRKTVFAVLFGISRGWLLVFLAWRAHHRKGDSRFDGVRDVPSRLFVYWAVQGVWVYCVSLPLLVVAASGTSGTAAGESEHHGERDASSVAALSGMALSVLVEIYSDVVKARWVAAGRPGGFCAEGTWKHSRHPNYAAEIATWVFAACYAVLESGASPGSVLVASVSPLFTAQILLNTSGTGVWNAEGKNLERYYEHENGAVAASYGAYRETTPPLFPLPPAVPYESLPAGFRRVVCFEWERYEYRPSAKRNDAKSE
mmetsp:Transcript_17667/g.40370  ORF Transcript_17667/g.40370 Transcript_17667/m.40370 type:complete len:330 (+) Transcript_17667:361-1350(+)